MSKRSRMLCAAAALLTSACGDGTGPGLHPSSYELVKVDDQPLPLVVGLSTFGAVCVQRLTSRRLDFMSSGRYAERSSLRTSCDDGRPDVASEEKVGGAYTTAGDSVVMLVDVPAGSGEAIPVPAVRAGRELRVVTMTHLGSGYGDYILAPQTFVYRAVP